MLHFKSLSNRLRKFVWFCSFGFVLLCLVYFNNWSKSVRLTHKYMIYDYSEKILGCQPAQLEIWDREIIEATQLVKPPLICNYSKPDLSYLMENGVLKFYKNRTKHYLTDSADLLFINCSYTCVTRGKDDFEILFGKPVYVNINCGTKIECQFPQVKCYLNETLVYAKVHAEIIPNKTLLERLDKILPVNRRKDYHHVILMVFDSVSLMSFKRFIPKTLKLLESRYQAITFKGMMRHGLKSWDNAISVFGGKSAANYSLDIVYRKHWDDWPFIWKNYSQNGYITFDDEDSTSNIFLYLKLGFQKQPMDHRYRVFWLASSRLYDYSWSDYSDPCYRNEAKHQMQFLYLHNFLNTYEASRPKFVLFWHTGLAHENQEHLAYLDDDFEQFLDTNHYLLKNSFLFVMGDHGPRYGSIVRTNAGHIESYMPPLIVSVPEDLRQQYPEIIKNMKYNSELLVSHYDTFVTLHDILESQKHGWHDLGTQKDWSHLQTHVEKAQSYLRPLEPTRTCHQTGIPPIACMCQKQMNYKGIAVNNKVIVKAGIAITETLNVIVSIQTKCAKMNLTRILKAEELSKLSTFDKYKDRRRTFRILVEVKPSNGTFEAIVRYDEVGKALIDGEIKRMNKYGNQFYCIAKTNQAIKQYCFCQ